VLSLLLVVFLVVLDVRSLGALIGFGISAFVGLTTLLEFWQAARARRRIKGENYLVALNRIIVRNRRRYGGYLVHLSIVLMAIGITGSYFFQQETQGALRRGETMTLGGYTILYEGLDEWQEGEDLFVSEATVAVYRDKERIATLKPRRNFYVDHQQPVTVPAVRSTVGEDFYVILVGWEQIGPDQATFKVYLNPLINWLWAGALMLIVGTLVAAWPSRRARLPVSAAYRPGMILTENTNVV
jgi:cytochrome c-type biogenesis protein CcmF